MKFCFFGNIADALKGKPPGGAELQVTLLAKALALKGHDIVIIDPSSNESFVTKEGIKLINIPGWNDGLRGIRFFFRRIPALRKTLLDQNADYYYVRTRSYLHLVPYLVSKKLKSKFIVAMASDLDTLSFPKKFKYSYGPKFNLYQLLTLYIPNDIVFNYLLKKADYIVIQHSGQMLSTNKIKGKQCVYPNIFDHTDIAPVNTPANNYFVHVGSLTILKGSDKLYELAQKIDKKNTIVVAGIPKDSKSKKIYAKLKNIENVILKGVVDHSEAIKLIANAIALINTSEYEGFPNIFLEAWATGIPVISLKVNPGNVIKKYCLGICCEGDLEKMKTSIEINETGSVDRNKLISYVATYHDFNTAADRFLNIL